MPYTSKEKAAEMSRRWRAAHPTYHREWNRANHGKVSPKKKQADKDLLSQQDLAKVLGISATHTSHLIGLGRLPRPTHPYGLRCRYTAAEVEAVKEKWDNDRSPLRPHLPEYLDYTQVSQVVGVATHRLRLMVIKGQLAQPTITVPGRIKKYFSPDDVPAIRAALDHKTDEPFDRSTNIPAGYCLSKQVLAWSGYSRATLDHHIKQGHVQAASHRFPNIHKSYTYYTEAEAAEVVAYLTSPKVPEGYVSVTEVAKRCGKVSETIYWHLRRGHIPKPIKIGVTNYYDADTAQQIVNKLGPRHPKLL